MGMYIYRVTAKRVMCSDGKPANVAKFAYKPTYSGWDAEKTNNRWAFRSGCYASDRMASEGKLTDRLVVQYSDGTMGEVYANPNNYGTFYDDCTFGTDRMPRLTDVRVI